MIGNGGAVEALPVLKPLLRSSNVQLRAAALDASRSLPTDEIDPILVNALRDESDEVREAAANALSHRRILKTTTSAELAVLASEPSVGVRRALMNGVWRSRMIEPRVDELFAQIARPIPPRT